MKKFLLLLLPLAFLISCHHPDAKPVPKEYEIMAGLIENEVILRPGEILFFHSHPKGYVVMKDDKFLFTLYNK